MLWSWVSLFLMLTLGVQQSYHLIGPALRAVEPMTAEVKARYPYSQPLDFAVYDDDEFEFDPTVLIDGATDQTAYRLDGGSYSAQPLTGHSSGRSAEQTAVGRPVKTCFTQYAHYSVWERISICTRSIFSAAITFLRTVVSRVLPTRMSISGAGIWTFPKVTFYSWIAAMMVSAIGMYFNSNYTYFLKLHQIVRRSKGSDVDAVRELNQYNNWRLRRVMQSIAVGMGAYILNWAIGLLIMSSIGNVSFKPHPTLHAEESLFVRGWRFLHGLGSVAGYVFGWEGIREWTIRAVGVCGLTIAYKLARCIESGFGCSASCCARERKPVRAVPSAVSEPGAVYDEKSATPPAYEDGEDAALAHLVPSAPLEEPIHESAAVPPSLSRPVSIVHYTDEDDESESVHQRKPSPREVLMSVPSKMLLRSKSNEMFMSRVAQASVQGQRLRREQERDARLRAERIIGKPL